MKDATRKFSFLSSVAGDFCAETFPVAKVRTLLPQNRRIIGCTVDMEYVASSFPRVNSISIV